MPFPKFKKHISLSFFFAHIKLFFLIIFFLFWQENKNYIIALRSGSLWPQLVRDGAKNEEMWTVSSCILWFSSCGSLLPDTYTWYLIITKLFKLVYWHTEKELIFLPNNSLKSSNFLTDTNLILFLHCAQRSFLGHFGWRDSWLCFKLLIMVKKGRDFLMRTALSLIAFHKNQFLPFLFCSCEVLKFKNPGKNCVS